VLPDADDRLGVLGLEQVGQVLLEAEKLIVAGEMWSAVWLFVEPGLACAPAGVGCYELSGQGIY
jgi:hypothetical protein